MNDPTMLHDALIVALDLEDHATPNDMKTALAALDGDAVLAALQVVVELVQSEQGGAK